MKKWIYFVLALLQALSVLAQVQISEVLYDPVNTESGGEAVELYNDGASAADISGWMIMTETSANDATIPANTMLQPKSYYLIADAGFSASKDNPSWPNADHEEAITLTNTDAGVALVSNGTIIDAVGWGSAAGIDAGLYEGSPHSGAPSGQSLQRTQDTQDNSADLISAAPNLQNSGYSPGTAIKLHITVTQSAPTVDSVSIGIDDDATKAGIQVMPQPKAEKQVPLTAIISNKQGINDTETVNATLGEREIALAKSSDINSTSAEYTGSIGIDFFQDPGNYTLSIEAISSGDGIGSGTAQFEYLSLIGLEIDASNLACSAETGQKCTILGDNDINTTNKVTVRNIGNVVIDSEVSGTDFSSGSSNIPVGSVKYAFNPDLTAPATLSTTPALNTISLVQGAMSTKGMSFEVTVPGAASSGEYVGTITLVAVQS